MVQLSCLASFIYSVATALGVGAIPLAGDPGAAVWAHGMCNWEDSFQCLVWKMSEQIELTLLGTITYPLAKALLKMMFLFQKLGYVSILEGILYLYYTIPFG